MFFIFFLWIIFTQLSDFVLASDITNVQRLIESEPSDLSMWYKEGFSKVGLTQLYTVHQALVPFYKEKEFVLQSSRSALLSALDTPIKLGIQLKILDQIVVNNSEDDFFNESPFVQQFNNIENCVSNKYRDFKKLYLDPLCFLIEDCFIKEKLRVEEAKKLQLTHVLVRVQDVQEDSLGIWNKDNFFSIDSDLLSKLFTHLKFFYRKPFDKDLNTLLQDLLALINSQDPKQQNIFTVIMGNKNIMIIECKALLKKDSLDEKDSDYIPFKKKYLDSLVYLLEEYYYQSSLSIDAQKNDNQSDTIVYWNFDNLKQYQETDFNDLFIPLYDVINNQSDTFEKVNNLIVCLKGKPGLLSADNPLHKALVFKDNPQSICQALNQLYEQMVVIKDDRKKQSINSQERKNVNSTCPEQLQYWNSSTLEGLWHSEKSFINKVYGQLIVLFLLMQNKDSCRNIATNARIQEAIIQVKGLLESKQHAFLSLPGNCFLEMVFPQVFNSASCHEQLYDILYELYYYCHQLSSGNAITHVEDNNKKIDDNPTSLTQQEIGLGRRSECGIKTNHTDQVSNTKSIGVEDVQNNQSVGDVVVNNTMNDASNPKDPKKRNSKDLFLNRFFFKNKYFMGFCVFVFCGLSFYAMRFFKYFLKKLPV